MYPPHHYGGYELVWQAAMRALRESGHQVRILTSDVRLPGAGPEEDPDVHRNLLWHWSWERDEWIRRNGLQRLHLERRNARELNRHLGEFRPDVVSWWSMGGMSLGLIERVRRRGLPSILVVHDDWLVYGPPQDAWMRVWNGKRKLAGALVDRLLRIPTRFDLAGSGRFLFNSEYTREEARRHGVEPVDAEVVTPGVVDRFLVPAPPRPWAWQVLYVGRVERQKGVDTAVAALAHLPAEASLTVIGDGHPDLIDELRGIAAAVNCGNRLRFERSLPADSLPAAYAEADVVVFPVRWQEPWGLVPLEAMGVGRPVVATARGGAREYLRDGVNAVLVPPDDPSALAAAIKRLSADPGLRARIREGGRMTAAAHRASDFEDRVVAEIEYVGGTGRRESRADRPRTSKDR
jgi:glycogen synthase